MQLEFSINSVSDPILFPVTMPQLTSSHLI